MAGRRTNLALFGLLALALTTGALAYGIGTGWARWAVVAHGAAGLGIVLLGPWKTTIARRGLRRDRPGRGTSLSLAVLVVVVVVTGVLHATGLGVSLGPATSMQVHVGAAMLSIPVAVWHVVARRVRPRRTDLSRRSLLRAGAVAGGSAAVWAGLEAVGHLTGLPGSRRRFTGSHERGSFRPAAMPVTQWLDDVVPSIDPAAWRLVIGGTDMPGRTLSLADLGPARDGVRAVLDCTGGWYAEQEWAGIRLDRLFPDLPAGTRSLVVRSATGYARRFPGGDLGSMLLALEVGGQSLTAGHGAPARIVAPGRRGFWWVKWVVSLEASETPWWWQPPFPLT
jgi:DMSO/TMAO reductase YedYZ molybdopterin-dependent catalytic subunit